MSSWEASLAKAAEMIDWLSMSIEGERARAKAAAEDDDIVEQEGWQSSCRGARVVTCLSTREELEKTEKFEGRKVAKGVGREPPNETPFVFIYSSVAVL